MTPDEKSQFIRELEDWGEAAVRADYNGRGGLATGGEDRRQVVREWLRDKERRREARETMTFGLGRRTYWVALGALVAAIAGVIVSLIK